MKRCSAGEGKKEEHSFLFEVAFDQYLFVITINYSIDDGETHAGAGELHFAVQPAEGLGKLVHIAGVATGAVVTGGGDIRVLLLNP